MLIDNTYFNGLLYIPNVNEPSPKNRTGKILGNLIDISEKEVLSFAFGEEMWEDFKQNWETNADYQKIVNGELYTKDDKKFKWEGLRNEELKTSFLADYVYCIYHTNNVTQTTEFGEVAIDTKVGGKASSTQKITRSWNRFLEQLQGGTYVYGADGYTIEGNPYWVIENRLGTAVGISYSGGIRQSGKVSLLQYLHDNSENYPLFDTTRRLFGFEGKNSFGV